MSLVPDASVVVAALVDRTPTGAWAERIIGGGSLIAPELLLAEATNLLRRLEAFGGLTAPAAEQARQDLLRLPIDLVSFVPCADRVWELRPNLTTYDAWYVSVAESADAPLATLDRKLARAPGPRCAFRLP